MSNWKSNVKVIVIDIRDKMQYATNIITPHSCTKNISYKWMSYRFELLNLVLNQLNHKTSWICSSDSHDLTKSHWNLMCLYNWNQASWTCTWISRVWKYEMRYFLIKVQNHMQLIANVKMHTIYFIVVIFNHFDSFICRSELDTLQLNISNAWHRFKLFILI